MNKFFPKLKLADICVISLFAALYVVLSQFLSPMAGPVKIGLSFVAVMFSSYLYGVTGGAITAGLGDGLGALLFPTHGAYFFGFTFTAIINGIIYGICLSGEYKFRKAIVTVLLSQLICSLLLNTAFNAYIMGAGFFAILLKRLIQSAVMIPIQLVVIHLSLTLTGEKLKKIVK